VVQWCSEREGGGWRAAAEWSQAECLKQLVKFGAKMDAPRSHADRAPLFACVIKHDDPEIVRPLSHPPLTNTHCTAPSLLFACVIKHDDPEIVRPLSHRHCAALTPH
jgi:hypothetical protein